MARTQFTRVAFIKPSSPDFRIRFNDSVCRYGDLSAIALSDALENALPGNEIDYSFRPMSSGHFLKLNISLSPTITLQIRGEVLSYKNWMTSLTVSLERKDVSGSKPAGSLTAADIHGALVGGALHQLTALMEIDRHTIRTVDNVDEKDVSVLIETNEDLCDQMAMQIEDGFKLARWVRTEKQLAAFAEGIELTLTPAMVKTHTIKRKVAALVTAMCVGW